MQVQVLPALQKLKSGVLIMMFFVGLHQPSDAKYFTRSFISVNRLKNRKGDFKVGEWILDSGAFSQIYNSGQHMPVEEYAEQIHRWAHCGRLLAAVSQDYMCEPFILEWTRMTVEEHQELTIERYMQLKKLVLDVDIMPVLQGYTPAECVRHIRMYGESLRYGAWVGVGSVCKRNSNPMDVLDVLYAIKKAREDLRLHGFGLKITALKNFSIRRLLFSADSMAWSYHARKNGRNANDWREAKVFEKKVLFWDNKPAQLSIYDVI
ncbi:MAG: hypothetical protein H0Z24_03105 [Thermosipho sp. (in: Bacteria)]|nr:hypothetical protein [Thermosipho sp. (in: thermotogales)]